MKGDFTRSTFNKEKHYHNVCMQQGRIMLDADWNEQQDLTAHRIESEALDVIGFSGTPYNDEGNQGFKLTTDGNEILIGKGHYYLNGVLCENEQTRSVRDQPDLPTDQPNPPKNPVLVTKPDKSVVRLNPPADGFYLGYLEIWQRHITALEAPEIREKALGGPDTATRSKTIWHVKFLYLEGTNMNCLTDPPLWIDTIKSPDGKLAAQTDKEPASKDPCSLASIAGYRRLENQLYRVEIHNGGKFGEATFKWSRDNGSVVAKWESQDENNLIVSTTGRDKVLNFAPGQWVELTDDYRELMGIPGTIVQLALVEDSENKLTIDADTATGTYKREDFGQNPKVRRWDMKEGLIKPINSNLIELEDGIFVNFQNGTFRTGDYWLIPARTATADVEWPQDETTGKPKSIFPHGVDHQYCKLAVLKFENNKWSVLSDCRKIFPPVTKLTNLFYVSGDGQESMPGDPNPLPEKLRVRICNGAIPVPGANVRFTVSGGGTLSDIHAITSNDGMADCSWKLGSVLDKDKGQTVTAELLDCADNPLSGQKVIFRANFSVAEKVWFNGGGCFQLNGKNNVQDAINTLCSHLNDIQAGEVSYIPECEYLRKLEVSNVQTALDELCKREQGGGCTVVVTPNDDIIEVIKRLIIKGHSDFCLCLTAGEHWLKSSFGEVIELLKERYKEIPPLNLKMAGCGAGTRFHIEGNPFYISDFNSLIIRDINFQIHNPELKDPIRFNYIRQIELTSCTLEGIINFDTLIKIENARHINLDKNIIISKKCQVEKITNEALWALEKALLPEHPEAEPGKLGIIEKMIITRTSADEFKSGASNFVAPFASKTAKTRKTILKNFTLQKEYVNLEPAVKAEFDNLHTILKGAKVDFEKFAGTIANLRDRFSSETPGNAVAIMDDNAETTISNNHIIGTLSIYGYHEKDDLVLPYEQLTKIQFEIKYLGSDKTIHIHGNHLTRLVISDKMTEDIIHQGYNLKEIKGLFLRSYISENSLEEPENQFLAQSIQITSNSFGLSGKPIAGAALGKAAIYTGNYAFKPNANSSDLLFYNFSLSTAGAANLNLNFLPGY
jgi:hypothetical protein